MGWKGGGETCPLVYMILSQLGLVLQLFLTVDIVLNLQER